MMDLLPSWKFTKMNAEKEDLFYKEVIFMKSDLHTLPRRESIDADIKGSMLLHKRELNHLTKDSRETLVAQELSSTQDISLPSPKRRKTQNSTKVSCKNTQDKGVTRRAHQLGIRHLIDTKSKIEWIRVLSSNDFLLWMLKCRLETRVTREMKCIVHTKDMM